MKQKTHEEFMEDFKLKSKHYNDIEVIGKYVNAKTKIECRCRIHTDYTWFVIPDNLLSGRGCKLCKTDNIKKLKTKTHEDFMKEFKIKNKYFDNIDIIGKYVGINKKIECKCKIHTSYNWFPTADSLLRGCGCPICANYFVLMGINDMWTTNKDLASLLKNPKDGYKYMQSSSKRIDWKCPNCGNIINDKKIADINKYGLSCRKCGDGITYPQKLMANILKELDVDFETEQYFDWCIFKLGEKDYHARYDFVFEYNNKNYIIETDGGLGHGNKPHPKSKYTKEELIYIDNMKNKLAKENNYELIRIDCKKSEFEYIKNNILNGKLNKIFDFNDIDWKICHKNSLKSKLIEACELWNKQNKTINDIAKELNLSVNTIRIYLKKGYLCNICSYVPKKLGIDFTNIDIKDFEKDPRWINIINVCKLWNNTSNSILEISKKLNISKFAVIQYLKIGNDLNLCSYNPKVGNNQFTRIKNIKE